jgi:hypothetical protein
VLVPRDAGLSRLKYSREKSKPTSLLTNVNDARRESGGKCVSCEIYGAQERLILRRAASISALAEVGQ